MSNEQRDDMEDSLETSSISSGTREDISASQREPRCSEIQNLDVEVCRRSSSHSANIPNRSDSSSTISNRRVVELLPGNDGDNGSASGESGYYIRREFYEEDIAQDTDNEDFDLLNVVIEAADQLVRADFDLGIGADDSETDESEDSTHEVIEEDGDAEEEEEEEVEVDYDTSLPALHIYLGENLCETRGREVLAEGSKVTLQLFNIGDIVLFPGQTLPLSMATWNTRLISSLKLCIRNGSKTIGLVTNSQSNSIGTTADVRNYDFGNEGSEDIKITLEGSQRFKTLTPPFTTLSEGEVLILPEISLGRPYWQPSNLTRFYKIDTPPKFIVSKHPYWIFKQYDAKSLIVRILEEIKYWDHDESYETAEDTLTNVIASSSITNNNNNNSSKIDNNPNKTSDDARSQISIDAQEPRGTDQIKPEIKVSQRRIMNAVKDPTYFSYWLASNLSISNEERLQVISMNCVEQRLSWLLGTLTKSEQYSCFSCGNIICDKKHVFKMSRTGPQCTFVNEYGVVHDTLTVKHAAGLISHNHRWSSEFSWFPGYEWLIMYCSRCSRHIGWRFRRIKNDIKPRSFFGLSRQNIKLSVQRQEVS